MANINLLTLHYADNTGSALQAYATCKLLKDLGHNVTVINLQNKKTAIGRLKNCKNWILIPRFVGFMRFRRRYLSPMTRIMFNIDLSKIPACDYTVVGSDQVWNSDFEVVRRGSYFLNFVNDGSKKIALASSFGKKDWEATEEFTAIVKNWLSDFSAISVRESSGVDICKDTFGVSATCVLDPTLALGDFSELVDPKPRISNEIRCVFFNRDYSLDVARFISERENMPIRVDGYNKCFLRIPNWKGTPVKWLTFIRDAKIWVSDSFHGIAFAIIYKKQFVALVNNAKKLERIKSLLSLLGLEEKLVYSLEDLNNRYEEVMAPIDYDKVYDRLGKEQEHFKAFVKDHIK